MDNNKAITYNIRVNDLIEALKEYEYVKIEFYKDGDYIIMSEAAFGYPVDAIHTEHYYLNDFEECNNNIKDYADWLESSWFDDVDVYNKYDKFRATIHVNWLKK